MLGVYSEDDNEAMDSLFAKYALAVLSNLFDFFNSTNKICILPSQILAFLNRCNILFANNIVPVGDELTDIQSFGIYMVRALLLPMWMRSGSGRL